MQPKPRDRTRAQDYADRGIPLPLVDLPQSETMFDALLSFGPGRHGSSGRSIPFEWPDIHAMVSMGIVGDADLGHLLRDMSVAYHIERDRVSGGLSIPPIDRE